MAEFSPIATLEGDARFDTYIAEPAGQAKAAIIIIQEIFGVNPGIRRKADSLAQAGYLALAPDLFWRIEPHIELDPDIPEEMDKALGLIPRFDQDAAIRDIEATIRAAWARLGEKAKVGLVGYCLGGRLAFMAACRTDGDAFVGYYAVGIDGLIDESKAIGKPTMLHIAGDDHFVSADVQRTIHAGLDSNRHVTLHDYPGLNHGFATEMGNRRDEAGAQLADQRAAAFFAEHLA